MKNKALLLLLFLAIPLFSMAQQKEIREVNGVKCWVHIVNSGENVYRISKNYDVKRKEIYNLNPGSDISISVGQELFIPINDNELPPEPPAYNGAHKLHTVKAGETLYRIRINYGVEKDALMAANPGLTENIAIGQRIIIPLEEENTSSNIDTVEYKYHIVEAGETISSIGRLHNIGVNKILKLNPDIDQDNLALGDTIIIGSNRIEPNIIIDIDCGNPSKQASYNIAFIIPLALETVPNIYVDNPNNKRLDYSAFKFIKYYEGLKIAIDDLSDLGIKANVEIFSIDNSGKEAQELIDNNSLENMDLIIGPLYKNNFTIISEWAYAKGVNIVNPFTKKQEMIESNNAIMMNSSYELMFANSVSYIDTVFPNANIVITHDGSADMEDLHKAAFAGLTNSNNGFSVNNPSVVQYSLSSLEAQLDPNKVNVIFLFGKGEIFASNTLRQINSIRKNYKIVVFIMEEWLNYDDIEIDYTQNLHYHYISSNSADYSNQDVRDFTIKFRTAYYAEPNKYAFRAYDASMFFFTTLHEYGKYFDQCLEYIEWNGLSNSYKFQKLEDGGYINVKSQIMRYKDYKCINAVDNPMDDDEFKEKNY